MAKGALNCAAVLAFVFSALEGGHAEASYLITLEQVGPDVVATGGGSLDLTDLTFTGGSISAHADIWPAAGYINVGPTTGVPLGGYTGFTGPTAFGSGIVKFASSGSGDSVEIVGSDALRPTNRIWVPQGYVFGTALADTATWADATFSSLGVTPGVYEWTWGSGAHADSFTLEIGAPEPSTWAMMALGFAALGFAGLRRGRPSRAA
jgi:hypothetical protein